MPRFRSLAVIALAVALPAVASAQANKGGGSFGAGENIIGGVVGIGSIGGAGVSIGGRFEHGMTTLPGLGNGLLAFGLTVDYYHWDCGTSTFSCSVSYYPIGASLNYHFALDNKQWDPYIGAGLGYYVVSCSYGGSNGCGYSSSVYFIGRAGLNYWFTPHTALHADVGTGSATINGGLMIKF